MYSNSSYTRRMPVKNAGTKQSKTIKVGYQKCGGTDHN
jgi:hypothetical protein